MQAPEWMFSIDQLKPKHAKVRNSGFSTGYLIAKKFNISMEVAYVFGLWKIVFPSSQIRGR